MSVLVCGSVLVCVRNPGLTQTGHVCNRQKAIPDGDVARLPQNSKIVTSSSHYGLCTYPNPRGTYEIYGYLRALAHPSLLIVAPYSCIFTEAGYCCRQGGCGGLAGLHRDLEVLPEGQRQTFRQSVKSTRDTGRLLPVYYVGLTGGQISKLLARLQSNCGDQDAEFFDAAISHALLCLRSIMALDGVGYYPAAALPDMWRAIWPWIQFLDTHRDTIPGINALRDLPGVYGLVLSVVHLLQRHDITTKLMDTTPGFRVFVIRMWALFLESPDMADETGNFVRFCAYINSSGLGVTEGWHLEEVLEGAGGTKTHIAALQYLADSEQYWGMDAINPLGYPSIISAIHDRFQADSELRAALIDQGVTTSLTSFRKPECHLTDIGRLVGLFIHFDGSGNRPHQGRNPANRGFVRWIRFIHRVEGLLVALTGTSTSHEGFLEEREVFS
ncbi:hypothetical protein B0H19DRAFT_1059900 [Mycena capillaripes]|nr:hypothetical protein B0H19DRAFT_1059900 [Mycena capillaripes]